MRRFTLLLATLLALPASAQINADRPGLGASPFVVGQGTIQVEAGTPEVVRNEYSVGAASGSATTFSFPVLLRYGLTETIEARVGTSVYDALRVSNDVTDDSETEGNAGFDAIEVGASIQLATNGPVVAVLPSVLIPTTDAGDLAGAARVAAGWTLTDVLDLTTTLGAVVRDAEPDLTVTGEAVAELHAALADAVGVFAEFAAYPSDDLTPLYGGGGVTFLVTPDVQFDASFDVGLNDDAADLLFGAGISARF